MVRDLSPSPGRRDWFGWICEYWRVNERRTHPRNESRSDCPRRAGTTMTVRPRRKFCRHKKTWMDRELALSPDVRDWFKGLRMLACIRKERRIPPKRGAAPIALAGQARP